MSGWGKESDTESRKAEQANLSLSLLLVVYALKLNQSGDNLVSRLCE